MEQEEEDDRFNDNEDDEEGKDNEDDEDNKDAKEEAEFFCCKNAWNDQIYQPAKLDEARPMGTS